MNSIILHILKRCLQFFLILIVLGFAGDLITNPIMIGDYMFSWFILIPAFLFIGIMIRDTIIRYRRKRNGDEIMYKDHPIVLLITKRFLQLFFVSFIVWIIGLIIIKPATETAFNIKLFSYANIITGTFFILLIIIDSVKLYSKKA